MTVPVSDLQAIAPSAVIELFELELNVTQHGVAETYRFHAGANLDANGELVWAGNEYLRFPVEADGFEYSGNGQLPRPKIRCSNILGTITALLLTLPDGLEGAKVTRIRTLARYIDAVNFPGGTNPYGTPDPTAEFPREIYYIDRKSAETRNVVEFELAAAFDLAGVRAPKRQCVANMCQWVYKSVECGYTGNAYFDADDRPVSTLALDVCGKRLTSCALRFTQLRRLGTVAVGSNVLTLAQATSFSTGDPVTGFGLPAGATVSSVSGSAVTLSAAAIASTSASTTGTIQSNLTQMVVSSGTGLAAGMTVTGNYLAANTQVTAVSGTTLTLGTPVDPTQFLTAAGSWLATYNPFTFASDLLSGFRSTTQVFILANSNPTITVGQYVSSSSMPLSRRARVVGLSSYYTYRIVTLDQSYLYSISSLSVWTFYNLAAISSASYSFAATDQNYTFRSNAAIPFGSFPGVGTFFT